MARNFRLVLLGLTLVHALWFGLNWSRELFGATGLLNANGTPVAGDFINLWSAALMTLSGRAGEIYRAEAFMGFERTLVDADIGLRLWAYPPQSLLLAWPLGFLGFVPGLIAWSALGLGLLVAGARRLGFDWLETAIVALCPAALNCLYYGQTGNAAAGLLLLALSARRDGDPIAIGVTALLTIKPQAGFLLPVLWLVQRRWRLLLGTSLLTLAVLGVTLLLFGPGPWRDYLGDTLATLNLLEREGSGPFMLMIPSTFMSFRILLGDAVLAGWLHWAVAGLVGVILIARLLQVPTPLRQGALVLLATVLMTPYLHNYDLAILTAGALLVARRWLGPEVPLARQWIIGLLVVLAWGLPNTVMGLNGAGIPLAPLLVLPLFLLA
ncbi:MAG: hypothetical protein JWR75_515 [Devosia sp.]|nr:hypothetical protein [Devosia sp.]